MELQLLAYCGLYCGACSFKLAHDTNDLEHLKRMPARYDAHKGTIPEPCPGCRLENQCGPCPIRDCARSRALEHCGTCDEFPCERLVAFSQDGVPHHAASISNLESVNAMGSAAWLEAQRRQWIRACGCRQSWYLQECRGGHDGLCDLKDPEELQGAALLAAAEHAALRQSLSFLPVRDASHYVPKLAWMAREGDLLGWKEGGELKAFLGGFVLADFRHAGPGAFSPDWCHGSSLGARSFDAYRSLYRELAQRWKARGAHIHAISVYATAGETMEAFAMTGFGRIVVDAARPLAPLLAELEGTTSPAFRVRRAMPPDAAALVGLNDGLAAHIGASPIFFPAPVGMSCEAWTRWLQEPGNVVFVAEGADGLLGYLKAQAPEFDVTDAVRDGRTLAICGAFTDSTQRGQGVGAALLLRLARYAREQGMRLLSVDCETANLEAIRFWTRFFQPVAWGLERRT